MSVITYKSVNDFLSENLNILLKYESLSQLLLINTLLKKDKPTSSNLQLGKIVKENNETSLIFVNSQPYNLNIFSPDDTIDISAVNELAQFIVNHDININGINANKAICYIFIKRYKILTNITLHERLAMDIMELRNLNTIPLPKGTFYQASIKDLPLLTKWYVNFSLDALNEIVDDNLAAEKMKSNIASNEIYIFAREDGKPVSMASVSRHLNKSVCISLVYTDSSNRGKGYGSAVVYYLSKLCLENGNDFCSLFVDKYNPISNKLYKKLGYKVIDSNYDYRITH